VSLVGIIANPAAGKDIRRIVSEAVTVNNHEKANIVRRVMLALADCAVERIELMPDLVGISASALQAVSAHGDFHAEAALIEMDVDGKIYDTLEAATYLAEAGAGCIVVLGGDGTARAVSKVCGETPILPVSSGTNNVVPYFIEGTVAGLAAGYVAVRSPDLPEVAFRHKRLVVHVDGEAVDHALVDVAVVSAAFVGSRAVWDPAALRQVLVTRAHPYHTGISSLVGMLHPISELEPGGATICVEPEGQRVRAPIVPGVMTEVGLGELKLLQPGERCPIEIDGPTMLALDGEREVVLHPGMHCEVELDLHGPWIVDVPRTLALAVSEGFFRSR
jgi:predicted polyphosphate/ATP-dependent NAD kinase